MRKNDKYQDDPYYPRKHKIRCYTEYGTYEEEEYWEDESNPFSIYYQEVALHITDKDMRTIWNTCLEYQYLIQDEFALIRIALTHINEYRGADLYIVDAYQWLLSIPEIATKLKYSLNLKEKLVEGKPSLEVKLKVLNLKQIFKKKKGKEWKQILIMNRSNDFYQENHPINNILWEKSGENMEKFHELIKEHIDELEHKYPQFEDFKYELQTDDNGSFYVLKARGV